MKRWSYVNATVDHPIDAVWDALTNHGRQILQGELESHARADGSFRSDVHTPHAPINPALSVTLGVGAVRQDGRRLLPITWCADTAHAAFPCFDGSVELQPLSSNATQVSVLGSYQPPLGPVGGAMDVVALRGVAGTTVHTVLDRLVQGLDDHLRHRAAPTPVQAQRTHRMTVGDVMTRDPFVIDADLPLKSAALLLFHLDVSGAPVVTKGGDLVGVLTERDLLTKEGPAPVGLGRAASEMWAKRNALTAGEACTSPALTTASDVSLHDAVGVMLRHDVRRLVVVDAGRISGILSRHDVLQALIRNDEQLTQAVTEVLDGFDEGDVTGEVTWGSVRLKGTVARRSLCAEVVAQVIDVDGIVGAEAEDLRWEVDDVAVVPPMAAH